MEKLNKNVHKNFNSNKNIFNNRFEEAVAISSILIIVIAIAMDRIMFLQACPLCVLTRYVFVLIAISALLEFWLKKYYRKIIDSNFFNSWNISNFKTNIYSKHVSR